MDPRHKLYKSFDKLAVDPEEEMSARTDTEAAQVQATSGVTMEGLKMKLEEQLGATYVEIEDMSGKIYILLYCVQFGFRGVRGWSCALGMMSSGRWSHADN